MFPQFEMPFDYNPVEDYRGIQSAKKEKYEAKIKKEDSRTARDMNELAKQLSQAQVKNTLAQAMLAEQTANLYGSLTGAQIRKMEAESGGDLGKKLHALGLGGGFGGETGIPGLGGAPNPGFGVGGMIPLPGLVVGGNNVGAAPTRPTAQSPQGTPQGIFNEALQTDQQKQESKDLVSAYGEKIKEATNLSNVSGQLIDKYRSFHSDYKKTGLGSGGYSGKQVSKYGGKPGESIQELDPNREKANATANEIVTLTAARNSGGGAVTDSARETAQASKPNPDWLPEAEKSQVQKQVSESLRNMEKLQFLSAAREMAKFSPEKAETLWQAYQMQRPAYDGKGANFEYYGSWRDYLTPGAIQSAVEGRNPTPDFTNPVEYLDSIKNDSELDNLPLSVRENLSERVRVIKKLREDFK